VLRLHCLQQAGIADGVQFYIRPELLPAFFDKVKY